MRMSRLRLTSLRSPSSWCRKKCSRLRLAFLTLFYNDHLSWNYAFDTAMEPLLWTVDLFARAIGPAFVVAVIALTAAVVAIAYLIGLPYYWGKSKPLTCVLVALGNYLLVNIVFHYWKALVSGPGYPPERALVKQVVSVCKKCIAPKPPRAHHCSVCGRCVLKMDHHCPWLNNCVGHWNHRHFFLYMVFKVAGCLFVMAFGFEIMYLELFGSGPTSEESSSSTMSWVPTVAILSDLTSRRSLIMLEAFLTTGCFLVLGGLSYWHARLITKGETSIEQHINQAERKRLRLEGKTYRNPYDFSPWYNWCLFLGVIEGRGWARAVLLPSSHPPRGDGLWWDSIYESDIPWNDQTKGHFGVS